MPRASVCRGFLNIVYDEELDCADLGSSLRPSCSLTASIDVGPVRSRCETTTGGGPPDLERRLPPPPPDCAHVVIGGHIVLMNRRTNVVLDIFHLEL
jgi:hypothetical protein